ncbi:DUF3153 domain-containing protein [Phormidium yuhuli AB48]|uniref:DUF3153 domain-containing protein n=1 Tax=Phormidium yuhuli AB48 TaxID=2940671 RepID=A0ABY5ALB6_9CYAN|nr:DUF3153 domain-containing protein [Phormidium yuhuli]USR89998.1 DUF3153 domain-containing protein [Phormidium yuhuli AB48]
MNFLKSVLTPIYAAIAAALFSRLGRVRRSRPLIIATLTALLLSGCVRYDVGIHFDSQTHGDIIQDVTLSQRFVNLSGTTVDRWTESLKRRARSLQGSTQQIGDRRWRVVIPFNNGDDLVYKFEQFFNPLDSHGPTPDPTQEIPELETHLTLDQQNFIFAISNHLSLDVDLRALGVLSTEGNLLISPTGLVDLSFRLITPWGAQLATVSGPNSPTFEETTLIWPLEPGETQHLEVDFWVPSPIGIGALLIILLVAIASYLKETVLPALGLGRSPRATTPTPGEQPSETPSS